MGNVQCCASGRFPKGKPPNKPKDKKKTKGLKGITKKSNGVGSGKGNGAVQKVVTMAEDGSEKAAPAEAVVQALPAAADVPDGALPRLQDSAAQQAAPSDCESDSPRSESMAAARERFFGQVYIDTVQTRLFPHTARA